MRKTVTKPMRPKQTAGKAPGDTFSATEFSVLRRRLPEQRPMSYFTVLYKIFSFDSTAHLPRGQVSRQYPLYSSLVHAPPFFLRQ